MIVVADSGSSKTDWVFIGEDGSQQSLESAGFNPVLHSAAEISEELATRFRDLSFLDNVEQVFFYGSGCWDQKRADVIIEGTRPFFPNAQLLVEHDLLGAARATCGQEPGIACILGTGSNSCLFDGAQITDNVTNLGYLMGDEGSGTHMGKMIIRAFFYRELPPNWSPVCASVSRAERPTSSTRSTKVKSPIFSLLPFQAGSTKIFTTPISRAWSCGPSANFWIARFASMKAMRICLFISWDQ